jgi:hypothetical protein
MNKIIKLIDGRELECYEIEGTTQHENIDNSLQLDTTGVYLQIGNRKRRNKALKTKIQDRSEVRFFVEHAHFFFEHSEEIRQDSRIAGSPLTHANSCGLVRDDGMMISKNIPDFMKVVKNFWAINKRYDEVKQGYKSFSLTEVINEITKLHPLN